MDHEESVNKAFKKHSKPFINSVREARMANSPMRPMFVSDRFEVGEEDLKVLGLKNEEIQDLSVVSHRLKRETHKRKKRSARMKQRQHKLLNASSESLAKA